MCLVVASSRAVSVVALIYILRKGEASTAKGRASGKAYQNRDGINPGSDQILTFQVTVAEGGSLDGSLGWTGCCLRSCAILRGGVSELAVAMALST